jgi:hypothetical protein
LGSHKANDHSRRGGSYGSPARPFFNNNSGARPEGRQDKHNSHSHHNNNNNTPRRTLGGQTLTSRAGRRPS